MKRDPAKDREWRERGARRYQEKQRTQPRKRLNRIGARKRRTLDAEQAFRSALRERAGGLCEVRTPACPPFRHEGRDPHHVWPSDRDRNVHDPARGLWVCRLGHDWIETNRAEARDLGWLRRDGEAA